VSLVCFLSAQVAAPPATPVAHGEPAKKERAPVTDDQLGALKLLLKRSQEAQQKYSTYTQHQVDEIFRAAAEVSCGKLHGTAHVPTRSQRRRRHWRHCRLTLVNRF
jgi:hypothetical protein